MSKQRLGSRTSAAGVPQSKPAAVKIEKMVIEAGIVLDLPVKTKAESQAALDAVKDGTITFVGAYHDSRKQETIARLEKMLA